MALQKDQKGMTLDSLMMSYADLTGPSKGSSFKGPAMKDVKVEKCQISSFESSQKAIDWSSMLGQNLEDAFVTVPQGQTPSRVVNRQVGKLRVDPTDDWGDFQEFVSPSSSSMAGPQADLLTGQQVTTIASHAGIGNGCFTKDIVHCSPPPPTCVAELEDDFGEFVSTRPPTSKHLISPPTVSVRLQPAVKADNHSRDQFKSLKRQNSIGSGLASSRCKIESGDPDNNVVVSFAVANNGNPTLRIPPNTVSGQAILFPPTSDVQSSVGQAPVPRSNSDKYSALRDISSISKDLSVPPQTVAHKDEPEDDFGDFVAVLNEPTGESEAGQCPKIDDFFMTQKSCFKQSNVIPWHDSSPPPPEGNHQPSSLKNLNQLIGFANDEILPAKTDSTEIFPGTNAAFFDLSGCDRSSLSTGSLPPASLTSPLDSLSLKSLDVKCWNPEDQNSFATSTKPVNGIGIGTKCAASPISEWCSAMAGIEELIMQASDKFKCISHDQKLLYEVVATEKAAVYVTNIAKVYEVFIRIVASHSNRSEKNEALVEKERTIRSGWDKLSETLANFKVVPEPKTPLVSGDTTCGVCLCQLQKEETQLQHAGRTYHSCCANFWVNCVDPALPNLLEA